MKAWRGRATPWTAPCGTWRPSERASRAYEVAGRSRLDPVKTAFTLSLASSAQMAEQAAANARRPAAGN